MYYPRWRKYNDCPKPYWKLIVGRYEGYVLDDTSEDGGYVGSVNNVRVTQKFQRTARQAKVVVLLAIRHECQDVLVLTDRMNTKY